ncbi:MAG: FHA domain-containing protein, partial [Planctomycetia bacterium]|nr:FHA domain-containing protein [Planctomycetia bacterium]
MKVVLRVTSGPHAGAERTFAAAGSYAVGRSPNVPFSLPEDRLLSREHFLIEVNPTLCDLLDLGSTNGTKVNGLRVERARLSDGDVIAAGDSALS